MDITKYKKAPCNNKLPGLKASAEVKDVKIRKANIAFKYIYSLGRFETMTFIYIKYSIITVGIPKIQLIPNKPQSFQKRLQLKFFI